VLHRSLRGERICCGLKVVDIKLIPSIYRVSALVTFITARQFYTAKYFKIIFSRFFQASQVQKCSHLSLFLSWLLPLAVSLPHLSRSHEGRHFNCTQMKTLLTIFSRISARNVNMLYCTDVKFTGTCANFDFVSGNCCNALTQLFGQSTRLTSSFQTTSKAHLKTRSRLPRLTMEQSAFSMSKCTVINRCTYD
jgi:hypothetical protein